MVNKEDNIENIEEIETIVDEQLDQELENVKKEGEEPNFEEIITTLLDENKKLKEDYLRAFADAENIKKRAAQEIEKNNKYAISSFAKNLLSVADNLQRAVDSVSEEAKETNQIFITGMELTQNELTNVLKKFGVERMETLGKIFDANYHQVVQEVPDPKKPAGTIIAEIQSGYTINDRILREAMVVVTK